MRGKINTIKKELSKWYQDLDEKQQQFLVFGIILPLGPFLLFLLPCLAFWDYTFVEFLCEGLLGCYGVVCSAYNYFYMYKKGKHVLGHAVYVVLIAFVSLLSLVVNHLNLIENIFYKGLSVVSVLGVFILTILASKKTLELINEENAKGVEE